MMQKQPGWSDDEDDDWQWSEDPEDTTDDSDDVELIPCPECGEPVPEDIVQCPYCGQYLTFSTKVWTGKSPLWIILGALGFAALAYSLILGV